MTIEWRTPALLALGWSEARAQELAPLLARGLVPARVVAQHRSHYVVSDGELERRADAQISPENAHFMLCGNPGMIDDVITLLGERGLKRHRQRTPGHITTEKYW